MCDSLTQRNQIKITYQWIDLLVALSVVILDMLELGGIAESRYIPVQLSQPSMDRGIATSNVLQVAFEMLHIHRVEADNGGEKSNVSFSDSVTKVVRTGAGCKMLFNLVQ